MATIQIIHEPHDPFLTAKINDKFIVGNEIPDLNYGFYTLTVKSSKLIKITNVLVDGVSIKHTLYLGHVEGRLTTELDVWEEWSLPLINPVSQHLATCFDKFPNKSYGTNLYNTHEIYYPQSISLPDSYPKQLRDFFSLDFNFHSHPKIENPLHSKEIPYVKLNIDYDESALLSEFKRNHELIEEHEYRPAQVDPSLTKPWQVAMVYYPGNPTASLNDKDFPELFKLIHSIDGIEIGWAFVGALDPGSYVLPHIDDLYAYTNSVKDCYGCCQIYIPIGWEDGNYFKFHDVGLVPFDQGAILANTTSFTHASVNTSTKTRYTIGIVCKFKNKDFLKYVSK